MPQSRTPAPPPRACRRWHAAGERLLTYRVGHHGEGTPVRPSVHKRPRRAAANCASLPSRPTLDRSALQGALPPAKPGNTSGKLDRKLSKSFCALPALTRQASGVGALHALGGSPAPQRSQFTRAHSMFVMPDRAAGGALQRTGSSTLQGMASGGSSPRGQQHPHPGATCCAKLQAMSLGADSPVAQPRVTQPVDQGGGSSSSGNGTGQGGGTSSSGSNGAGLVVTPAPGPEEEAAAELAGAGLTARCSAAARTWSSLSDFSALRVVAQGGRSTVWEAVPKAPDQCDLPGGLLLLLLVCCCC